MSDRSSTTKHPNVLRRGFPVLVMTLATLFAAGCGNGEAEGRPGGGPPMGAAGPERPVPVAAEVLAPSEVRVVLRGSANLRAREQVDVLPKQAGVITRILVEEGTVVAAGAPLAAMDSEEWELQAAQAEARARAAQDAAARARQLQEQGLISDQEVERLQSEADVAEADLGLARLRVRNAVIAAPIGGAVTHREVERGQQVTTSTVAFRVADISRLEAVVGVPEREASRVQPGQAAMISIEGGTTAQGSVARVRPVVDPASGTVQVVVEVDPGQAGGLRPGQFVNVDIVTETLAERLTLPRTAVLVDAATPRVYVITDGRAEEREVELGVSQAERVEIRQGVAEGDTVVIVGQDNLRPDSPVNLLELNGQPVPESERPRPTAAAERQRAPDGGAPAADQRR